MTAIPGGLWPAVSTLGVAARTSFPFGYVFRSSVFTALLRIIAPLARSVSDLLLFFPCVRTLSKLKTPISERILALRFHPLAQAEFSMISLRRVGCFVKNYPDSLPLLVRSSSGDARLAFLRQAIFSCVHSQMDTTKCVFCNKLLYLNKGYTLDQARIAFRAVLDVRFGSSCPLETIYGLSDTQRSSRLEYPLLYA